MNPQIKKGLWIAGLALLTVPATVLAQKEKEEKDKAKNDVQSIIITRTGDIDVKTVIEIDGDKIRINGKDAKDMKDIHVNVNTMNDAHIYRAMARTPDFDFHYDDDHFSIFTEDENRAMLGVTTQVTSESGQKGAEIVSITKESGAEKAGLKKGDILTKIGDKEIKSTEDVTEAVRAHKPGDKVDVSFTREGKTQKVTAELGKWKGIKMNAVRAPRLEGLGNWGTVETPYAGVINGYGFGRPRLGLSIQDTEEGEGVKVLEVEEESNAAKAGIKENDIIIAIDGKDVKGTDDITKTIRENKDKTNFSFRVKRDGKTQNIEVKMPKKLKTTDL